METPSTPPSNVPPPAPPPPMPLMPGPTRTSGQAVASLVFGIVSLLGGVVMLLVPPILAIVLGHVARGRIAKSAGQLRGEGIALAGLICGYVSFVVAVPMVGLMAAMAIPAFQAVRENAIGGTMDNDARQIASAAQQYLTQNPNLSGVRFSIDPTTGAVQGPLSVFVRAVTKGVQEVDGRIDLTDVRTGESFSLRHPQYRNGRPLVYTFEGRRQYSSP